MLKIPRSHNFSSFISKLPVSTGVYKFKNSNRESIYIGKAKNLKNRLKSYLSKSQNKSQKIKGIISEGIYLDLILTKNELDSLILEQHLIKEEKPKYNVQFKDDKGYPWIVFEISKEFPAVRSFLGRKNKDELYFGPFPNSYSVKNVLDLIQKIFKLRDCSDSFFKNRKRPCLQYEIGRCSAPCVGNINQEEYLIEVQHAKHLLKGKSENLIKDLYRSMDFNSKNKLYERAVFYRDKISALREIQRNQSTSGFLKERDAISICKKSKNLRIGVTEVRGGWIVAHKNFISNNHVDEDKSILENFLSSYYFERKKIPPCIVLPEKLTDKKILENALENFHGKKIKLITKPGKKDQGLLEISHSNTNFSLFKATRNTRNLRTHFVSIKKLVDSISPIKKIEALDISHHSGKNAVGACIVYDEKGKRTKDYRTYKISKESRGNDIASMQEIVRRRYKRGLAEKDSLPDLVIIDGAYNHLKSVRSELNKLDLSSIKLLSISKGSRRKEQFDSLIKENGDIIKVNRTSKTHLLIQEIRNESHRFSINNQRKSFSKQIRASELDQINGIGSVNKNSLIRYFGDVEQIKKASIKDMTKVSGVGRKKALEIYNFFHKTQ